MYRVAHRVTCYISCAFPRAARHYNCYFTGARAIMFDFTIDVNKIIQMIADARVCLRNMACVMASR